MFTFRARHVRPSFNVSRRSYTPLSTPVIFRRSSCSTAPSESLTVWLDWNAFAPAFEISSLVTVEVVRFQNCGGLPAANAPVATAEQADKSEIAVLDCICPPQGRRQIVRSTPISYAFAHEGSETQATFARRARRPPPRAAVEHRLPV